VISCSSPVIANMMVTRGLHAEAEQEEKSKDGQIKRNILKRLKF